MDTPEIRTFKTRLEFIRSVFKDKYPPEETLKKCIEFKLKKSYENYLDDLTRCYNNLASLAENNKSAQIIKKLK